MHNYASLRVKEIACSADRAMPGGGLGETQQSSLRQFAARVCVVPLTTVNSTGKITPSPAQTAKEHSPLEFGHWAEVSSGYS